MLIEISTYDQVDERQLMDVYQETNGEDVPPGAPDREAAIRRAEQAYLHFIRHDFLPVPGNRYMVWAQDGVWVSALRLYRVDDTLYYIGALETCPECRGRGYAVALLNAVTARLKERGIRTVRDCVERTNASSLRAHEKAGFAIYRQIGYDYAGQRDDPESYGLQIILTA